MKTWEKNGGLIVLTDVLILIKMNLGLIKSYKK